MENKATKAPNPYAKNTEGDVAMALVEMSGSSSSDDDIPESAKRRETKMDMEDEDYSPEEEREKEYPAQGSLAQAIKESKEKKLKAPEAERECHVVYCKRPALPNQIHCELPGHQHRLDVRGNRICSTPGCNTSTFNLQTEKCNLHLDSRRVHQEKRVVATEVKQKKKKLDPTDVKSYTIKDDIKYNDRIQIRVLENKETKGLLYHAPAVATIWYKPCTRDGKTEKFATSSAIVQALDDTDGEEYLSIEGGGLKGGRTTYLTRVGLLKTFQKRKADHDLYNLFGLLELPLKEEEPKQPEEEDKKIVNNNKKKRKRPEVEHVIQCGHIGCLRTVPTSTDTLCNFHQAEAVELKEEAEAAARDSKNALMLQGMMLDNEEHKQMNPPPAKKQKTEDEEEEESKRKPKKSVRWQCLNCDKEAVEGLLHCSDHIPSPDFGLGDTEPQLLSSVEPLTLPKPAATFIDAAMSILTKPAMESSVPMEEDMTSSPGVVLPPPPKQEEETGFVCADRGRPRKNSKTCSEEFKGTGRCEYHYNKLTGVSVTMGARIGRACHYPTCKLSLPSELINFCGDEAHKIRPDNQGARYCKTPTCLSLLSSDPSEFYCILHKNIPVDRSRASKARIIQEDTICTWDGKCQETIADPNSLFCGEHHQESKARQEAVNKAQEKKQQLPLVALATTTTQTPDQQQDKKQQPPEMVDLTQAPDQQQSEVDKLKAENEALQRQLKLNSSIAFMCNKTDMLKSFSRQAEFLKYLYLPGEQHKEILGHLDAMHNLVKEFAGRRV